MFYVYYLLIPALMKCTVCKYSFFKGTYVSNAKGSYTSDGTLPLREAISLQISILPFNKPHSSIVEGLE
jgi:hypothetical protein